MAELHFSDRMEGVSGSAIREIFKIVQKGNVISFAGGNPNPKTFPQEALADISARILRAVSYTHLDVYKRQFLGWLLGLGAGARMTSPFGLTQHIKEYLREIQKNYR